MKNQTSFSVSLWCGCHQQLSFSSPQLYSQREITVHPHKQIYGFFNVYTAASYYQPKPKYSIEYFGQNSLRNCIALRNFAVGVKHTCEKKPRCTPPLRRDSPEHSRGSGSYPH
jgi:hypothetical protein